MSKKVVEPTLYTAQELDVIRTIIADEVGPLGYPVPGIDKRMVILGGNLRTFLLHEGFTCAQAARKQCTQTIEVLLTDMVQVSDEDICSISLCTSSIWVKGGNAFPIRMDSIGELVAYLHTLLAVCRSSSQCRRCYYGEAGPYCGLGMEMVEGCSHHVRRVII